MYDPDLYDAEIILDRSGITQFDDEGLARLFGVSPTSVRSAVSEGRMEEAELRVRYSHFGTPRYEWTRDQVIRILASGKHPHPKVIHPCGTEAAAVRHLRNGTPVCDACRDAQNAARRKRYAEKREAA